MVNGHCFGGGFTQVCACDFALTADEAIYGLSEINWGIIPGGLVSWNMVESLTFRDALYYSLTGDTFDGKQAAAMRLVNKSVPLAKLRDETIALSALLQKKNPLALRYTKEALRAVKGMSAQQALDYLDVKIDSLIKRDPEQGRQNAMKQFLDSKTFRPGFAEYKR
jgi:trans-feruloyl-CoA hydratase/vanillin synthase